MLFLIAGCTAATPTGQVPPWPTNDWARSTAAEQGLDAAPLDSLHAGILAGTYGNVDRMVVVRNGYLVRSERYPRDYVEIARDQRSYIGCGEGACDGFVSQPGYNYFDAGTHPWYMGRDVHSLQSVTKSVTATALGAAIHEGLISGVDVPLLSYFDDYDLSRVDPRLQRATLSDLLTMRSGIEWHETDRPLDGTNTTARLEASEDWVQFTLDEPMDAAPGEKWAYNSGGSHLMSAIVRKATGMTVDQWAEQQLFGPLGITDYYWKRTPAGLPDTEGGLYLEAEQLAKIGYLYLHDGVWDGQRLLPEGWAGEATARIVENVNRQGWGYGYQWWRLDTDSTQVIAALGFGEQYLLVLPAYGLIGVVNCWNVFGDDVASILLPFRDALIASVAGRAP
jgi:CubicO group peptidase (beta-lactamase class C family)